jgi:hypothetical protein
MTAHASYLDHAIDEQNFAVISRGSPSLQA